MKLLKLVFFCIAFCHIAFAQDIDKEAALKLIKENASVLLSDIKKSENPIITNAYLDVQTGISFIYFQQQHLGIKVFNQIKTAAFKERKLLYHAGNFINNITDKAKNSNAEITALNAIENVAADLKLPQSIGLVETNNQFLKNKKIIFSKANIARRNIKVELVWMKSEIDDKINLAWNVSISPNSTSDNWLISVDALTGKILSKVNETVYETFEDRDFVEPHIQHQTKEKKEELLAPPPTTTAAVYNVVRYPYENRFVAGVALETNPWTKAGAGNAATTNGWHFDGTTNYNITRGNNVFAYDDSLNIDAPGRWAISNTALPNLNFNFTPNFSQQPTTPNNRNFAVTNLFYWNNIIHDIAYQYGFTEAAGNFQADNLGRGGLGNDFVLAEAQDGGGINNANFWADGDGDTAIMQMYLFRSLYNLKTTSPIAANYVSREGSLSTNNLLKNIGPVTGEVVLYNSGTDNDACNNAINILTGKIAVIKYAFTTGCSYTKRIKNAQNAGAIGVILVYTSNTPITMGGNDNTITIPAVMIGANDGTTILNQLLAGTVIATLEAGLQFDGDIDNGVVVHEYGHGISIRLTGGAANSSCLNNAEQAGEGWSDYLALMLSTTWSTATINDGVLPRPIGVYAFNQTSSGKGIRTYPYSTDMAISPINYSNMASNGQVHFIGEIWCATLWDMTWDIIKQENIITPNLYAANGAGGNVIAMNLVMLGMKLQPCSPGFLDSRDAILAADDILYNGKHKCTIWKAFARRGMGFNASQGSSGSTTDQVVSFDEPNGITLSKLDGFAKVSSSSSIDFNIKASCYCKAPTSNYKIKAVLPQGFSYQSSTGGTSNADSVIFSNINFQKTFQTDSIGLSVTATASGCALDSVINDNRDAKTIGGFVSSQITGTSNWVSSTEYSYSPSQSWKAPDVDVETDFALTSNSFTIGNFSLLSFWHLLDLEGSYDGGVVELSTDGGISWQDIGANFLQNGYNNTIASSAPFANKKAFSGSSNGAFKNTIANVSKFKGSNIKIRYRVATDIGNGSSSYDGWFIDDIAVTNGCGGLIKFYAYDSANNLLDSTALPLYITPKVLPVKYSYFFAKAANKTSELHWLLAEQKNMKMFKIERSSDGRRFEEIAEIPVKNISQESEYIYYDTKPVVGENYYRIKAVDFDGAINFSTIQKVNFNDDKGNGITIIPNPTKANSKIYLPTNFVATALKIFDMQGKEVLSKKIKNSSETYIDLNTDSLTEGVYLINVMNKDGKILTEKLVIVR